MTSEKWKVRSTSSTFTHHVVSTLLYILALAVATTAQERKPQNKPYIDLRPMHFGISVGFNTQDIEFQNVGPQLVTLEDGTTTTETVVCDQDNWNPGFSVGVLAEMRLNNHLAFRVIPSMHFGTRNVTFMNHTNGEREHQILKSTFISIPLDVKFSAERFNNYRPYLVAGVNPMYDLTVKRGKELLLKPFDCYLEIGMGCDFYLPFFKCIPEIKFAYGLANVINKNRSDLTNPDQLVYTDAISRGHSKMIILSLYFE